MAKPLAKFVALLTPKRRWAQFSLATMFVVVAAIGVTLAVEAQEPKPKPQTVEVVRLNEMIAILKPLHAPLGKPRPNDWLDKYAEMGQTFEQYLRTWPNVVEGKRRFLYVQPLGEFDKTQRKIVALTADFMGRYFGLSVRTQDDLPLSVIPVKARRTHPKWGVKQILSTYVLDEVLAPRRHDDAVASIALTTSDLWPGEGWNFVFGQASLADRVGVWSINRNGDPDEDEAAFRLCLLRTLKTATHETGHMFSIPHCTAFECGMCGSNHREEADRHPIEFCPECLAKLCWATRVDPQRRFERLAEFCREQGLAEEQAFYEKSLTAMDRKD